MSITHHRYHSTEEIVRDKNRILQKLGVHEDYAFELRDMMMLGYSDSCLVDRLESLNWLIKTAADSAAKTNPAYSAVEHIPVEDAARANTTPHHTLIITRGLPASGKSTFARAWVEEDPGNRVEINRDSTRKFLGIRHIGTEDEEKNCDRSERRTSENLYGTRQRHYRVWH